MRAPRRSWDEFHHRYERHDGARDPTRPEGADGVCVSSGNRAMKRGAVIVVTCALGADAVIITAEPDPSKGKPLIGVAVKIRT